MSAARGWRAAAAVLALVLLGACATTGPGGKPAPPAVTGPVDPWENFNRKVFGFNEALDRTVLRPVAETYRKVVPSFVRTGVDNVLGNIYDVWSTANHFLQGKVQTGLEMGMRVLTNTIFGLAGLLDPASDMGLTRHSEDFGQTLGRWGLASGPFLVLPLFGPSTVRDAAGFIVDRQVAPSTLPRTATGRYAVAGLELVNTRANLLATGNLVDQVALDKYSFIRDAYLARRRDAIYDGAPPVDPYEDEPDSVAPAAGSPANLGTAGVAPGPAQAASAPGLPARAASVPAALAASAPASGAGR